MQKRLTTKQVSQIVAEVERLSQRRQSEVEVEELQQILQELNLPDDLLDEAVMQVYRKQALDKEKKRNGLIIGGVLTVLVSAIAATFFVQQQNNSALENIEFSQSRIGFRRNDSANLKEVERQNTPELFYNVTLQNAPVGKQVELGCNWLKPNREIAHKNSWKTKAIATEVWNTHCRYKLKEGDAAGNWIVQMTLNDEAKISNQFFVK
ncbi:hypothetical protein Riv7116_1523 [Rivularia sp. PCC 7116]|uniref:hypothetical protein n=1 Tax=Rivularia sp. PCC 7116 TaxID=373994 RepID=UPI00029EFF98|nr:hypothetical protein [Rivularia sp. PCC 7116]AFY54083.1 hypothetical protein Riv7116_1523 [Rivularia sp. PCC 7116]